MECKYFFSFRNDQKGIKKLFWAKEYQIEHYNKFQDENGFLVYVLIGVGGFSAKPERAFLIPLKALKYSFASESYLQKFERKVGEPFYLEKGYLK